MCKLEDQCSCSIIAVFVLALYDTYVCMHVYILCMYIYMYVFVCMYIYICMYVCLYACTYVHTHCLIDANYNYNILPVDSFVSGYEFMKSAD